MSIKSESLTLRDQYFEKTEQLIDINSQNISIKILKTSDQFNQLEDQWNDLLKDSSSDSIFLTWEWISTWWKYFQNSTDLFIITARDNESKQLTGIAPLAITNVRNIAGLNERTLVFIGNGSAGADHLDFIIRNGFENTINQLFSEKLWEERHSWNQIKIEGLIDTSSVIPRLLQHHPQLQKKVDETICPYLSLPEDWETLNASFSKNMRYNLGRFQRRLEKDYPDVVEIRNISKQSEIKNFMSILVDLHTASQERKNNAGLFSNQNMIDFHTEIAEIFISKDWLRSYTLNVGQTSIAAIHCYQYNGTVSFYQSGFDQFWQRYSPGSQIMAHAIKQAIQEKNEVFDFLRGEEDYKFKWTKFSSKNLVFTIPFSFQSQVSLQLKQISRKIISL